MQSCLIFYIKPIYDMNEGRDQEESAPVNYEIVWATREWPRPPYIEIDEKNKKL